MQNLELCEPKHVSRRSSSVGDFGGDCDLLILVVAALSFEDVGRTLLRSRDTVVRVQMSLNLEQEAVRGLVGGAGTHHIRTASGGVKL